MTFYITTLIITSLSITILSITTICIAALSTEVNYVLLNLTDHSEHRYTDYRYAALKFTQNLGAGFFWALPLEV